MKRFELVGVGNAIVDIIVEVSEEDFKKIGLEKRSYEMVGSEDQLKLLKKLEGFSSILASGGAIANSIIAFQQLGGKAGFQCSVGDDKYGKHYEREFAELGIGLVHQIVKGGATGTCVILVTPDGERTMRTCLGVASTFSAEHVNAEMLSQTEWLLLEGYMLACPETTMLGTEKALEIAKKNGVSVALTLSDKFIVEHFRAGVDQIAPRCDLVFANIHEAECFVGSDDRDAVIAACTKQFKHIVITAGEEGAYICRDGKVSRVDAFPCVPKDLTGAGDMFAGAYLFGISHGAQSSDAARRACFLAREVITRVGARLHTGVQEYWAIAANQ